MKTRWMLALLGAAAWSASAWTPPADPNPEAILKEARADARDGRLADAAAKHRWYHENVLGLLPSHSGVRLSFALTDWAAVARRYPPALADLRAVRDRAMASVRAGDWRAPQAFGELLRLNEVLDEPALTVEAFSLFAPRHPVEAGVWLSEALPALVAARAYPLASAALDSEQQFQRLSSLFATLTKAPNAQLPAPALAQARQSALQYIERRGALLVLTLVNNERRPEAEQLAGRVRELLGGSTPWLDAALRGQSPPPAPRLGEG